MPPKTRMRKGSERTKPYATKMIIVYLLDLVQLFEYKESAVPYSEIVKILQDHDIDCDKKTVKRNMEYLKNAGYLVVIVDGKVYWDKTREIPDIFNKALIKEIIDKKYKNVIEKMTK